MPEIGLEDIAALPPGDGKALAITLWNRLIQAEQKEKSIRARLNAKTWQLNQIRGVLNLEKEW